MGLLGGISDAVSSARDKVSDVAGGVKKVASVVKEKVSGAAQTVGHAVKEVDSNVDDFGDSVKKGVEGLTHGKTGFNAVKAVAGSVADKAGDTIGAGFGQVKKGVKKYGAEALKIGVVVGAGAIGAAIGGPLGAAAGGALAASLISAYDQKRKTGKIDPLKVGANGLLGAIPGGGGVLAKIGGKAGSKLLATSVGKAATAAGKKLPSGTAGNANMVKSGLTRAVDGGSFGFRFGAGDTVYDGAKKGNVNWSAALTNGGRGALSGAVTGGLIGGVSARIIDRKAAINAQNAGALQQGLRPNKGSKTDQVVQRVVQKLDDLPVPVSPAQMQRVVNEKVGPQFLGGTATERIGHVFGRTAPVQTRKTLQGTGDYHAHAAEQLVASPTGLLVETADQVGKRLLFNQLQATDFFA